MWERVHNCLCNSWSLLNFCHFFLILFSLLRNHVQSQQQKSKVRSGSSLRVGVVEVPLVQVYLGGFWVFLDGFCWLRVILHGFRWFAVLVVKPILQHTEHLIFTVLMVVRDWLRSFDFFFQSKTARKTLLLPCRLAV